MGPPSRNSLSILLVALVSRLTIIGLTVCFHLLATSYDTSSELNTDCLQSNSPAPEELKFTNQSPAITGPLDRFITWDSVHFVRIAQCGYEFEQSFAFFPALPLLMRGVPSTLLWPVSDFLGERGTLWLAGLLLSNCAFIASALCLYRLGRAAVQDEALSYRATLLYCWNPASIFYSSVYTESLFALASFAGMYHFLQRRKALSLLLLAASTAVRSNGILHAYFFLFNAVTTASKHWKERSQTRSALLALLKDSVASVLVCTPFALFQAYGYWQVCVKGDHRQDWCNRTVPYIYGHVQDHYWNVGFLRYFQLKQLPNFLLASPMIVLSVGAVASYAFHDPHRFFVPTLWPVLEHKLQTKTTAGDDEQDLALGSPGTNQTRNGSRVSDGRMLRQRERSSGETSQSHAALTSVSGDGARVVGPEAGFLAPEVLCFTHQLAVMVCVATLIMHVQVATRFLSASPVVYWYAASLCKGTGRSANDVKQVQVGRRTISRGGVYRWIWGAFVGYSVIGTLLFTNFYPFT